jgi:hypothetical protein
VSVIQQELGLTSVCIGHGRLGYRERSFGIHRTNDLPGADQNLMTVLPVGGFDYAVDDYAGLYEGRTETFECIVTDVFALDYALHDTSRISNY